LSSLHLPQPGSLHATLFDERERLRAIDLRPDASRTTRSEALQPLFRVQALLLAVDPAEAQGGFDRFGVTDGRTLGVALRDH